MPNPLRSDPTRTTMLRRQFGDDLSRRFTRLDRAIRALIVTEDAFGLEQGSAEGVLATNTRWAFQTNPQKLASFKRWLSEQVDSGIISVDVARYLNSAYRLGLGRSFTDSRIKDLLEQPISFLLSSRDRFVQNAMNELVTVSKLEVLYTRAFDQLEGITKQMSGQLSRILADGLVDGSSARTLARRISEQIGISKKRALVIARTEIIHAHAEGQLDAFERLGIDEVDILLEWIVGENPCPVCRKQREKRFFKVSESHGLIPMHPNCQCTFVPIDRKSVPLRRSRRERLTLR